MAPCSRTFLRILGLAALVTSTGAAAAADPVTAEALFREARDAARAGDYAAACPKFAESQRLGPAVGTLLNLARCEGKLGRVATAWQHLRQVIDQLSPADDRLAYARAELAALELRLPRLTLVLDPAVPEDAVLVRDGVSIGRAAMGSAIPIDPGEHVIELRVADRTLRTERVTLVEGEHRTLVLTADPAGEPMAQPVEPTPEPADATRGAFVPRPIPAERRPSGPEPIATAGWIALAVGATGVSVGAVTGGFAIHRQGVMRDHCDATVACDPEGLDAAESGATFAAVATFSTVLGLSAIAAGGILLLASPSEELEVAVAPAAERGIWGARLRARY